jgi:hypothetical protein
MACWSAHHRASCTAGAAKRRAHRASRSERRRPRRSSRSRPPSRDVVLTGPGIRSPHLHVGERPAVTPKHDLGGRTHELLRHLAAVGTVLIASATGCGDNQNPPRRRHRRAPGQWPHRDGRGNADPRFRSLRGDRAFEALLRWMHFAPLDCGAPGSSMTQTVKPARRWTAVRQGSPCNCVGCGLHWILPVPAAVG